MSAYALKIIIDRAPAAQADVNRILRDQAKASRDCDLLPDPCPFCGCIHAAVEAIDTERHAVCCPSCGGMGPPSDLSARHAVQKWNLVKS